MIEVEERNELILFSRERCAVPDLFDGITEGEWVAKEMKKRETDFIDFKSIKVFCGTWNVNGKLPNESLENWIGEKTTDFHIIAFGFQELDLSPEALIRGTTSRSTPWEQLLEKHLNSYGVPFTLLHSKQLVGMLICIFVRDEIVPYIKDVTSSSLGIGIMGKMGNKGGVGVRFRLHDSTLCFVNSHLSAHEEQVVRRNQDYRELSRRLIFVDSFNNTYSIFDHDNIFWFGDLNYRIKLPNEEVRQRLKDEQLSYLFDYDQLNLMMQKNAVFDRFKEGPISFFPTFKFDVGTDKYDTSEKKRTPSWCDRVLWVGETIHLQEYNSHDLRSSDHRPVSARFRVEIKVIRSDDYLRVFRAVVNRLNSLIAECVPKVTLSESSFYYPKVRYLVPSSRTVTLSNIGPVIARFRFETKIGCSKYAKSWLFVNPIIGTLLPGENVNIKITIFVSNKSAPSLNTTRDIIDDLIILRILNGSDHYLTITGSYCVSSFGNYLDNLVRYPFPIRTSTPIAQTEAINEITSSPPPPSITSPSPPSSPSSPLSFPSSLPTLNVEAKNNNNDNDNNNNNNDNNDNNNEVKSKLGVRSSKPIFSGIEGGRDRSNDDYYLKSQKHRSLPPTSSFDETMLVDDHFSLHHSNRITRYAYDDDGDDVYDMKTSSSSPSSSSDITTHHENNNDKLHDDGDCNNISNNNDNINNNNNNDDKNDNKNDSKVGGSTYDYYLKSDDNNSNIKSSSNDNNNSNNKNKNKNKNLKRRTINMVHINNNNANKKNNLNHNMNKTISISSSNDVLPFPKELSLLLQYLSFYTDLANIFMKPGNKTEIDQIIELLDTTLNLSSYEGSPYSVAQCLLIFLESLGDPVIPENLYNHCIEAASSYAQCKQIVSSLKVVNYHSFWKIILFLRQLYSQSQNNKLSPQRIAVLFSNVLIRTTKRMETIAEKGRKAEFIFHFITKIDK